MRFISYSDAHFYHGWSEFNPITENGLPKRFADQLSCWHQVHDYGQAYNVSGFLFSGDFFHKRSYQHTIVINSVVELYKSFLDRTEILAKGNHDRFDQNFSAVDLLDGVGKAKVLPVVTEGVIETYYKIFEDQTTQERVIVYSALPGDKIPEIRKNIQAQAHILLAHGTLQGASSQSGFELTSGYTLKDFEGYSCVLLGDIHLNQCRGNVLIPGSFCQQNWGDSKLECGCWLIDTDYPDFSVKGTTSDGISDAENLLGWRRIGLSTIGIKFLPIKAPKFIVVTQENFDTVLAQEKNDYDYFDFRLSSEIDKESYRELKRRFPNSYIVASEKKEAVTTKVSISQKNNTPQEILEKYHQLRVKDSQLEKFIELGLKYLLTADPKQLSRGHKNIELEYIRAQNFLAFKDITLDFRELKDHLYQVTGTSDDETSVNNGTGKSSLAVEILCFTLYDKLARSSSRSKDRLILDPDHTGKAKDLLTEVGLKVGDQSFVLQRFRKHSELGTGSRILQKI